MSELVLSSAAKRLRNHPAKERVLQKYREGETPQAIAEWLQHDMLLFPESSVGDLAQAVVELFVTEVPMEERLELSLQNRSALRRTLAKQKTNKSTYELIREMALVQQGRIEMMHEVEFPGEMHGALGYELETLRRMLMNMHEIEQDLGVRPGESQNAPGSGISADMKMRLGKALKSLIDDAEDDAPVIDVEVSDEDSASA